MSYDVITNRISTAGYQYDANGNLTRGQAETGVWQRYQYDAANRLVAVMNDSSVILVTNSYGADNGRLKSTENGVVRWYGWDGGQVALEYSDNGTNLVWAKSYVYLGGRLLLTDEPVIGRQYHHADRLGTRIVTNASGAKVSEQATLPFGTALGSPETSGTPTNRRFTSYDRSGATKLDYAVNRSYASWQGRFTQVDPMGMGATSVGNPQSLNLYGYVENDPVNFIDPTGLNKKYCVYKEVEYSFVKEDGTLVVGTVLALVGCYDLEEPSWFNHRNDPKPFGVDGNIYPSSDTTENLLDGFQTVLDVIGLCPGLGELADGASGLISSVRGDADGASLSIAALVPFGGWGAGGSKIAKDTYRNLRKAGIKDAHHIIQDAAVRNLPGYSSFDAPAIHLPGPSTLMGSLHSLATEVQRQAGGGTYAAERRIGYKALRKAGVSEVEARAAIQGADNFFLDLGVTPQTKTRKPCNRR